MKSFKAKALLARQLSLSDWLILAEAWRLLLFSHLALRWTSYERLMTPARPASGTVPDSAHALICAQRLQRLVGYAARLHPTRMTCLDKSLALQKILSGRNIPARIRIGVRKTPAEFHAHAWVEMEGAALGEAEETSERFKVLSRSGA